MITSLPFHLLIVHLAVVAVPVAALLTLTLSIRPTLYPKIGKLTVGVVTVASASYCSCQGDRRKPHDNPRTQRSAARSGVHARRACRRQRYRLRNSLPRSSRIARHHHHGKLRRCRPSLTTPRPQLPRLLSECESVRSSTSFAAINDSISDTVGISSHPAATTTRPATIAPPHSATESKKSSDQGH